VLRSVQWSRALSGLDFALATLAAFGLQVLLDRSKERVAKWGLGGLTVIAAIVIGALWVHHLRLELPAAAAQIQAQSFVWPVVGLGALAVGSAVLLVSSRQTRSVQTKNLRAPSRSMIVATTLFAAEAVFLLTATPNLWSSSKTFLPTTPAVAALQHEVGNGRVGFAACPSIQSFPDLGIWPEANDLFSVSEDATDDPIIPKSYFTSYFDYLGESVTTSDALYCPSMTSARLARHFGVGYVLAAGGSPAPSGTKLVNDIAGEDVYRVPGGGVITVEPRGAPQDSPNATVEAVQTSDPNAVRVVVAVTTPSTMYVHITNFPGWTATINGHKLGLHNWGGSMLSASLPTGRHVILLSYEPETFKVGIILAAAAALVFAIAVARSLRRS
jgi:hypothetical protein